MYVRPSGSESVLRISSTRLATIMMSRVYSKLQKVGTWHKDDSSWGSHWYTFWGMGIRSFELFGVYCKVRCLGSTKLTS